MSFRRDTYFANLKFPPDPQPTIGVLHGKSNFNKWLSKIQPVLLSNPHSSDLILGNWPQPKLPTSYTTEEQAASDEERREWHAANTATCRFIRATLAENVTPFVRQYTTAKTLFLNLVWLYGEDAGIDTQGGPALPVAIQVMNAKKGRASLLAALEAKRTIDHLPRVGVMFRTPSPVSFNDVNTHASSSSSTHGAGTHERLKTMQPVMSPETTEPQSTLVKNFEQVRISLDQSLDTIHEHEDPHPGRRVPSGYAIGLDYLAKQDQPEGSISPLALSNSGSEYEEDDRHLEDISKHDTITRPKKRQASVELEERPQKASFGSILKNVKPGKVKKRDKFPFSFPLRRLYLDKEKGNRKDNAAI